MDKSDRIILRIKEILTHKKSVIVAIDGRCASGKTTLAECVSKRMECNVIHMDDFFLQPHQRTAERLNEPGGNIDYERFVAEVLLPLKKGESFAYRPYNCRTGGFGEPVRADACSVTLIEGSYSCHPMFAGFYDIRFFMDVEEEEQLRRIKERNGATALEKFKAVWIPMEEKYFTEFNIGEKCERL